MDLLFVFNAVLLGFALAMDAFSVSLANGLSAPRMKAGGIFAIAGTFAFFQWFMPMLGWVCVYYFVAAFSAVRPFIPYVALGLLLFIGGRMIAEGVRSRRAKGEEGKEEKPEKPEAAASGARGVAPGALLLQGIATSIDALSTGFTFVGSGFGFSEAMVSSLIIAAVTFAVCVAGVLLGRRFGTLLAGRATIVGGGILIAIGIEIFVKGVFFA